MSSLRRNGLLSSCEPCRKAKLRCDHAIPCSRCRRRKRIPQCVYHPAPMTKAVSPDSLNFNGAVIQPQLSSRTRNAARSPSRSCLSDDTASGTYEYGDVPSSSEGPLRDRFIAYLRKKTASSPGVGVLGPTSYSAVFDESEDIIKTPAENTSFQEFSHNLRQNLTTVDDAQIQLGAELLHFLYEDFVLYERMAISNFRHCEGYIFAPPLLRLIFASVRHMLHNAVRDQSNPLPSLLQLSKSIFENCSKPIHVDAHMTPQDYFISMPNRWEVIGMVFSVIGSSSYLLPASELIALHPNAVNLDRKGLCLVSIAAGERCLRFCDNAGVISEPLTWSLVAHTSLLTHIYGDHDYRPWKFLGDLASLLFALGFHQKEKSVTLPFFLDEHRKRLMVGAYAMDKELSTFLGRPPHISWRHIDVDLPLDITYEELIAEPERRDAAIQQLDQYGWNTHGQISQTSCARGLFLVGRIRELVLEVSLNTRITNVQERIREISELAVEIRSKFPPQLRHWNGDKYRGNTDAKNMYLCIHLEFLYNDLIMQRILVKRTGQGSEKLLKVAHEMLSSLLLITGSSDLKGRDSNTVVWTVSFFGLPSAGVLAIELLRRSPTADADPTFPRSEIIQNLSRFAADLEHAVDSAAGNYEICQQGRKVITCILDRVLSAPQRPLTPVGAEPSSVPVEWLTSDDIFMNQDPEFMRWISSYDWSQELPLGDPV